MTDPYTLFNCVFFPRNSSWSQIFLSQIFLFSDFYSQIISFSDFFILRFSFLHFFIVGFSFVVFSRTNFSNYTKLNKNKNLRLRKSEIFSSLVGGGVTKDKISEIEHQKIE